MSAAMCIHNRQVTICAICAPAADAAYAASSVPADTPSTRAERIQEIEARLKAATPGPLVKGRDDMDSWHGNDGVQFANVYTEVNGPERHPVTGNLLPNVVAEARGDDPHANARLIAHIPDDIAYLLAVHATLTQRVGELEKERGILAERNQWLEEFDRDVAEGAALRETIDGQARALQHSDNLLAMIAGTLKGNAKEGELHSYHDLPQLVATLEARVRELGVLANQILGSANPNGHCWIPLHIRQARQAELNALLTAARPTPETETK